MRIFKNTNVEHDPKSVGNHCSRLNYAFGPVVRVNPSDETPQIKSNQIKSKMLPSPSKLTY